VVALGAGAGAQHTCAVLADGQVQCWGYDNAGQLGAGASTEDADRFSPAPATVRF
jgi:alpha-tubulin suppressor-like RCC1 family protein